MKLTYIANIRMPTERAHGIQIMEMCHAFAAQGLDVALVVPNRRTDIADDPFVYYDIKKNFEIKKIWCLDTVRFGKVGFWLEAISFATSALLFALTHDGIFYTREEIVAFLLSGFYKKPVWESHRGQTNIFVRTLMIFKERIVVITEGLKDLYMRSGASERSIFVAPDGADIDRFDIGISRQEARKELGLPQDKRIILYKGSLEAWKGAGTLAGAARHAKTSDTLFVFIGGKPQDVENFKKEFADLPNFAILGNRPRKETPIYQKAADLLIVPNSAKEDISKLYTSPMKLFGYMAGGVPIVASDLPSIREVLNEDKAYFFAPDDPESLGRAIDMAFAEPDTAKRKATRALEEVRNYSWTNRAKAILEFVNFA